MGVVAAASVALNTREDAFRLIVSILAGYPLAAIYRTILYNKSQKTKHLFIIFAGILIYLFNCGVYIYHSLVSIVLCWVITNFFAGKELSVLFAHVCFLGHMLIGYAFTESSTYDITWTTPFCIMTLRFIGLVMDVYDGHKKEKDKEKPENLKNAIYDKPSIFEIAAFGLFFAGTLVGPQFSLRRFREFVNGEYLNEKGEVRESSVMASIRRFAAGIFFAVIHQWGMVWIPDEYFNSVDFDNLSFIWKIIWNTIWFRAVMYRYCAVWLLTEGAAILSGLAYNGKELNGDDCWDGVRDIHIIKFELGHDFSSVIESFNCGTNTFAKNHIFKRLRWLGSKFASQTLTLFYLAIWHGYHLGYFLLFAFEMACMLAQEQLYSLIRRSDGLSKLLAQPFMRPFCWIFGRVTINISMAFAFFTFGLVKKEIWIGPLKSMYFYGYIIFFAVWPVTYYLLSIFVRSSSKREKQKDEKKLTNGYISKEHNKID